MAIAPSPPALPTTVPVIIVAASGAAQTVTFDPTGINNCYEITLTAACVITLTGGVSGKYQTLTLILRQSGAGGFEPTIPTALWPGSVAPTPNLVTGKVDVFTYATPDAGTTRIGNY